MGGSMSIKNETSIPLSISLNQVGPLYYENVVEPGETFYRSTGAVDFTVVAQPNPDKKTKNSTWTCAAPILMVSGGAIATVATAGWGIAAAAANASTAATAATGASVAANGAIAGFAAGAVTEAIAGEAIAAAIAANAAAAAAAGMASTTAAITSGITAAGTIGYTVGKPVLDMASQDYISSPGWYAAYNHKLKITGGYYADKNKKLQWKKLQLTQI